MNMVNIIVDMFKKQAEPQVDVLAEMAGMSKRNEARIAAIKEEMGEKWILHPSHKKDRLQEPRPV